MATNVTLNDVKLILESYKAWKHLNQSLSHFASRTVNFPEAISESLVSFELDYVWHNKTNTKKAGDATSDDGKLVEVKATSKFDKDLTSFSPKTKFEILIFARLKESTDELYIYDLNMDFNKFQTLNVSSKATASNQQAQGRRPRLSLVKYIDSNKIQPTRVLDLKALASRVGLVL